MKRPLYGVLARLIDRNLPGVLLGQHRPCRTGDIEVLAHVDFESELGKYVLGRPISAFEHKVCIDKGEIPNQDPNAISKSA